MAYKKRNTFLSRKPGKNAFAVKSAIVKFRCLDIAGSAETFELFEMLSLNNLHAKIVPFV